MRFLVLVALVAWLVIVFPPVGILLLILFVSGSMK